jgi:hypothetical protein
VVDGQGIHSALLHSFPRAQPRGFPAFSYKDHPHPGDELIDQVAGFGSLFSSIKRNLQLLRFPSPSNATITSLLHRRNRLEWRATCHFQELHAHYRSLVETTIPLEVDVRPAMRMTTEIYADACSDIEGRFCSDECCLPCPLTELVYSDRECISLLIIQEQADVVSIKNFPRTS